MPSARDDVERLQDRHARAEHLREEPREAPDGRLQVQLPEDGHLQHELVEGVVPTLRPLPLEEEPDGRDERGDDHVPPRLREVGDVDERLGEGGQLLARAREHLHEGRHDELRAREFPAQKLDV